MEFESAATLRIVLLGGLLAIFLLYKFILYPSLLSPLAKIPNAHWSAPISPFWILYIRFSNKENFTINAEHQKRGSVVRLGPNEISVNTVEGGVKTIYGGGFEKGQWYSIFDNYGVPCMFSVHHSRPHSLRKRMTSHVYSKSTLQSSPALHAQARIIIHDRLLPLIASLPSQTGDVLEIWNSATMDFVTAYQFGLSHSANFLIDPSYRKHWLDLYQSRKNYTFFPQELPALTRVAHRVGVRLVPRWVDAANDELEAWCLGLCRVAIASLGPARSPKLPSPEAAAAAAAATIKSNKDAAAVATTGDAEERALADTPVVLQAMLAGIERERRAHGDRSLLAATTLARTELSVASEMLDNLAAGQETSGITLTYLAWHLSRDPALQAALRAELLTLDRPVVAAALPTARSPPPSPPSSSSSSSAAAAAETAAAAQTPDAAARSPAPPPPPPTRGLPAPRQLDALPLLHAIVMETLRRDAAIPGAQPRVTPAGRTSLVAGFALPGGVRVGSSAYGLHRNEDVYADAEHWDHTRWLDGDGAAPGKAAAEGEDSAAEKKKKERDRWFWAFSSGGRMCIGSNFAMHQMKLIIAAVYTNYTTHIVDDEGIEQLDGYTCGPASNKLILRFEPVVQEVRLGEIGREIKQD